MIPSDHKRVVGKMKYQSGAYDYYGNIFVAEDSSPQIAYPIIIKRKAKSIFRITYCDNHNVADNPHPYPKSVFQNK